MKIFLKITFFFVLIYVATTKRVKRIIGSEPIEITEAPYQLQLFIWSKDTKTWVFRCGASIITRYAAITAASCFEGVRSYELVRLLAGNKLRGSGRHFFTHPRINHEDYVSGKVRNDIAILHVTWHKGFGPSNKWKAIPIATKEPQKGDIGFITGWGWNQTHGHLSKVLQGVEVAIADRSECKAHFSGKISQDMICAGYPEERVSPCDGDIGGPLVVNGKLAGIISWGLCTKKNYPLLAVYTNVAHFRDWIKQHGCPDVLYDNWPECTWPNAHKVKHIYD